MQIKVIYRYTDQNDQTTYVFSTYILSLAIIKIFTYMSSIWHLLNVRRVDDRVKLIAVRFRMKYFYNHIHAFSRHFVMTMNYRCGIIFCSCRILIHQKKRDIFDEYVLICWGHDCAYQIRKKPFEITRMILISTCILSVNPFLLCTITRVAINNFKN